MPILDAAMVSFFFFSIASKPMEVRCHLLQVSTPLQEGYAAVAQPVLESEHGQLPMAGGTLLRCSGARSAAEWHLFFSKVVSFEGDVSQLGKGGLPHEAISVC